MSDVILLQYTSDWVIVNGLSSKTAVVAKTDIVVAATATD